MAVITCKCGEIEVHLLTSKPLFRLICCCNDCNAILQWAAWKNKAPFYPAFQGIDKIYMENSLRFLKGENFLRWVKLTENSVCFRSISTCCYSSLFVENLSILGPNIACIDRDFCNLEDIDACEITAQIFEKDVPINRRVEICENFKGPRFDAGPEENSMWPSVVPTILKAQSIETVSPEGYKPLRKIIEKSVKSYGWINLEGYNDNNEAPIVLTGTI